MDNLNWMRNLHNIILCDVISNAIVFWCCEYYYWCFMWKTSVFICLPALWEKFAQSWQKYPGISASRFTPPHFCWQIFWQSADLPADLPPPISAGRFAHWQIRWQSLNLVGVYPPPQQISWLPDLVNLPADLPGYFCQEICWHERPLTRDGNYLVCYINETFHLLLEAKTRHLVAGLPKGPSLEVLASDGQKGTYFVFTPTPRFSALLCIHSSA